MTMRDGPPDYADPIVLRMRFVPRRREAFFPTHVASAKAWEGYVTDAQMWDALRMAGYDPETVAGATSGPPPRSAPKHALSGDAHTPSSATPP